MISASDFRNGVTFDMDGKVMQIVEFQHVKPGKGAAFVRVKMKNVMTGAVTETRSFPGVEELRKVAFRNLDQGLLMGFDLCIAELIREQKNVCRDSLEARDFLRAQLEHRSNMEG